MITRICVIIPGSNGLRLARSANQDDNNVSVHVIVNNGLRADANYDIDEPRSKAKRFPVHYLILLLSLSLYKRLISRT